MQANNLLIAGTRTSEMKMFSITNLDDTFSRKCKSSCAVNWTHLFVTLMIKRVLRLHFWGSSNENQGSIPATHTVKQSWIWVNNVFFFRCKIWFHQCAAIVGCFCNYIHLLKLQIWQRCAVKVGQTHRSVWDSQEKDIVVCESVCDPESGTEVHLLCVLMTYSLCFFKNSVTHFPTLLCLLDKCHIVHDQQKTEVTPLTFFGIHS